MFFVRKSKTQLYERLLEERERLVQVLAAERQTWVQPASTPSTAPVLEMTDLPDEITLTAPGALTDEQEQLEAMRQAGVLSPAEYDEAVERLARRGPSDIIE